MMLMQQRHRQFIIISLSQRVIGWCLCNSDTDNSSLFLCHSESSATL